MSLRDSRDYSQYQGHTCQVGSSSGDCLSNGQKWRQFLKRLYQTSHLDVRSYRSPLTVITNGNFFNPLQPEIFLLLVDAGPNSGHVQLAGGQQQHYGLRGREGHRHIIITTCSVGRSHGGRTSQRLGGSLAAAPPPLTSATALFSLLLRRRSVIGTPRVLSV